MASSLRESRAHDRADGSNKLKVAILASEWGSSKGGLSTINRELAIQLAKFPEVEITFFLPQCSQEDKQAAFKHNIQIVEATRRPGYEELEWLSFPPEHLQIDVIVGHGVKLSRQPQVIKDFKKCMWVQVVHTDLEELGMSKNYKTEVELCEMADLVVGVGPKLSEAFRTHFRGSGKDLNVLDLTPGVSEEFMGIKQVSVDRKYCSVLVFGRGGAADFLFKGIDIAAKAVAALPDTRLVFVGAPDEKHEEIAEQLIGCGVPANRLRVRNFVQSRESLRRLFQEVDLVLVPSRTEGFGLIGLEFLSAGLPVLVSQKSGFGDALSNVQLGSSFVINSEDPNDWAAAIKSIWTKDRKRRLDEAEAVRDSYAKKYNWAKQIKNLLDRMVSMIHEESSDGQNSSQTKGGMFSSAHQVSPWTEDKTEQQTEVPSEINLRGRSALEAYNKALTKGKACVKRIPVMLIGQDHSGKTSLKNSLLGKPFNPDEDSTVGIDVDPSYFKVSTQIWKAEENAENTQATDAVKVMSFEHHAARLVAEHLKEEKKNVLEVGSMKSMKSGSLDVSSLRTSTQLSSPSSDTSRDATESIQTPKDPKVQDRKRLTDDASSVPTLRREERPFLSLPQIPDRVGALIKKLLQEVEKVQDDEEIYSVLWDFGGQSVYYATHPLFITARAMYLLVYDLSRDLHERAQPVVKQGMYKKILDGHGATTNLDYLNFWMTSVASLGNDECQHVDLVGVNVPPVFLVCTHADKPYDGADPFALAHEVFDSLQTKPYRNQLYGDVFVVDNTKSGAESECSEVKRLREKVLAVAKELPQMKEAIPIKWLEYEKTLQITVKEGHKWISFEVAKQIASEVCKIDDDQEFLTLLNFLHDQRILIHFDDTPVLNDLVVLDPQWLVDVFKKVITVKPYDQEERKFKELWRRLETTGILDERLLEHEWGPLLDQQETSASLIKIMEKFSLLCPWPSSNASCGRQYLVPSMLMWYPLQDVIELVASAQIPSLFLRFESGQVPPGVFPRLVLQFFQWGQDEFWSPENPHLYLNFARFYTSGDDNCSVILLCHASSIEIVVHRGNLSTDLTECLSSKLNMSGDVHYDAFEMACARAVRRKLGLMLECMRKEFSWLKNMKHEVGFICSICCQGHAVKFCCTHHKQGCELEECLHFWSESDLRSAKQFIRCRRCATAKNDRIYVKRFTPWISQTSDEQLATDGRDGRLPAPEGGNDEKLQLALASKALQSLSLQSCDSKEVVLQLQLDQASLERPDSETKRLIRCLATKAKQLNRLDVIKHLREITPAGTTGPLLPERLNIRNIPVRQMRDFTVELSSGEEWKVVAEELGLTPREIRFLDKRTVNPCDAALAFISRQRYISVGDLYNRLNKCGLPVIADLL